MHEVPAPKFRVQYELRMRKLRLLYTKNWENYVPELSAFRFSKLSDLGSSAGSADEAVAF